MVVVTILCSIRKKNDANMKNKNKVACDCVSKSIFEFWRLLNIPSSTTIKLMNGVVSGILFHWTLVMKLHSYKKLSWTIFTTLFHIMQISGDNTEWIRHINLNFIFLRSRSTFDGDFQYFFNSKALVNSLTLHMKWNYKLLPES